MHLNASQGYEQRLGDVLVAHVVGGELRDSALACGERLEACLHDFARSCSGRRELVVRLLCSLLPPAIRPPDSVAEGWSWPEARDEFIRFAQRRALGPSAFEA